MPSLFSHAMAAVAVGSVLTPKPVWRPFVVLGALCAVVPDLDIFGPHGIDVGGEHRGLTHSLTFAAVMGIAVALGAPRRLRELRPYRRRLAIYIALATATHGALDALTNLRGVKFLSPFSSERYTAPWHPLRGGWDELLWCFLPLTLFAAMALRLRGIQLPRWQWSRDAPLSVLKE
jgi:inner membrane protein